MLWKNVLAVLTGVVSATRATRATPVNSLQPRNASQPCNNSPDLCSRSYSNITHLGAHDSPFTAKSSTGSITITEASNQNLNSTAQLDAGVRLLSAQVHNNNGAWHLCHSTCSLLDAGNLSSWLASIKTWLDGHPYDVVTILLVNSDGASAQDLSAEFESANISSYGYVPASSNKPLNAWPTLNDMIAKNTRLVTFVTPLSGTSSAGYLLSEFDYVFENPYNVTNPSGFQCQADRPSSLQGQTSTAVQAGYLPLMNHFLYSSIGFGIQTPNTDALATTNGLTGTGSLGQAASACQTAYGQKPVFILVDFFDQGSTLKVVDNLNGITAVGRDSTGSGGAGTVKPYSHTSEASPRVLLPLSAGICGAIGVLLMTIILV